MDISRQYLLRWVRLTLRRYRLKTYGKNWFNALVKDKEQWQAVVGAEKNGPKILIATSVGSHLAAVALESLLAAALSFRGADVHVLLCDSLLPACMDCDVSWFPKQKHFVINGPGKDLCRNCFWFADKLYSSLGFKVHRYSEFLTGEDITAAEQISSSTPFEEIEGYIFEGIKVGEHTMAGALRFCARASLEGEPYAEPILRRYFKAALLTTCSVHNLLRRLIFDCVAFHHGIYVPQGLVGEVARREKVRVVNWNPAYRKRCFIFSQNDTYHHTLMTEKTSKWEGINLSPGLEKELMKYLKSRWKGTEDWIWFHEKPQVDLTAISNEVGVDFSKPCIGMLTNVMWDAQLHYPANAFPNMLEWIKQTIEYFGGRPELQLIIRVHPAEIRGVLVTRQPVVGEVRKAFPELPGNVFIIPPESNVSTYAVMSQCNAVIIYGTKTGVELTSMGVPVIVAGEAWIRNKGITMDAASVEDYFMLLDRLPVNNRMDNAALSRARKYAFHFFFRRMIPLEFMVPVKGWPPYRVELKNLDELMPGRHSGLDVICDGILGGSDFIFPAEKLMKPQGSEN